jgi:hypothetical protein
MTDAPLGIKRGMTSREYFAAPGLSHSGSRRMRQSPFHYHALLDPLAPQKAPTPAMFAGTLAHCALLEPLYFDARYPVPPLNAKGEQLNKNSNEWKQLAAEYRAAEREPITQAQRDLAFAQAAAMRELPEVAQLLADGHPEVSVFWIDPATGVRCKARPDWVSPVGYGSGVILLDAKTTTDASPEAFAKSCANFDYHCQAAHYTEGYALASELEVHGMVFAVVESEFPFAACAYMLDDEAMEKARAKNAVARQAYAQCERENVWPGYPSTIQVLTLPAWA